MALALARPCWRPALPTSPASAFRPPPPCVSPRLRLSGLHALAAAPSRLALADAPSSSPRLRSASTPAPACYHRSASTSFWIVLFLSPSRTTRGCRGRSPRRRRLRASRSALTPAPASPGARGWGGVVAPARLRACAAASPSMSDRDYGVAPRPTSGGLARHGFPRRIQIDRWNTYLCLVINLTAKAEAATFLCQVQPG